MDDDQLIDTTEDVVTPRKKQWVVVLLLAAILGVVLTAYIYYGMQVAKEAAPVDQNGEPSTSAALPPSSDPADILRDLAAENATLDGAGTVSGEVLLQDLEADSQAMSDEVVASPQDILRDLEAESTRP